MIDERRKYKLDKVINVNGNLITEVIIDSHVDKHSDHIDDDLIISLVSLFDGKTFLADAHKDNYSYFISRVLYSDKIYRLVWLQQENQFYIGVVTSFRDKGAKDYDIS